MRRPDRTDRGGHGMMDVIVPRWARCLIEGRPGRGKKLGHQVAAGGGGNGYSHDVECGTEFKLASPSTGMGHAHSLLEP